MKRSMRLRHLLRENMRTTFFIQGVFLAVIFWIFFKPMILHAYNLTIRNVTPSGDDIYFHAYFSLKILYEPLSLLQYNVLSETIIPTQYPNLIHYILSLSYLITSNPMFLIKAYGVLELIMIITGTVLYILLLNYILLKNLSQTIILSSLIPLFSYWILQTLAAGSIMYLLDLLVFLPITVLSLISRKFMLAGFIFGFSCLNWLGFLLIGLLVFVWFLIELISALASKNIKFMFKQCIWLLIGLSIGGNIFLVRFVKHFLEIFHTLLVSFSTGEVKASGGQFYTPLTFNKFSSYLYIRNDYFLFAVMLLAIVVILISSLSRKLKPESGKILVWLNVFWIMLLIASIGLINLKTPNAFEIQIRCLRTLSFLTIIPIVSFFSVMANICGLQSSLLSIRIKEFRISFTKPLYHLLIAIIVVMLFSSPFLNFFTKLEKGPDGLFRMNEKELQEILFFRERFVKLDQDIIILGIEQVGSFLLPLLSIPEKNITVFLLTPPKLLTRLDPNDPQRKFSEIFTKGILMKDSRILALYNIKYLVIYRPQEKQFYWKEVLEFFNELWDMNFSTLGEIIYETNEVKIWKFKMS